jgi:hypothetical protein
MEGWTSLWSIQISTSDLSKLDRWSSVAFRCRRCLRKIEGWHETASQRFFWCSTEQKKKEHEVTTWYWLIDTYSASNVTVIAAQGPRYWWGWLVLGMSKAVPFVWFTVRCQDAGSSSTKSNRSFHQFQYWLGGSLKLAFLGLLFREVGTDSSLHCLSWRCFLTRLTCHVFPKTSLTLLSSPEEHHIDTNEAVTLTLSWVITTEAT